MENLNSIVSGLATIRAFNRTKSYASKMHDLIDEGSKIGWHLAYSLRWGALRLGLLNALYVTSVILVLVFSGANAAYVGFTVTFVMQLSKAFSGVVRQRGVTVISLSCVDEVMEYVNMPQEDSKDKEYVRSRNWPTRGRLEVKGLTISYDPAKPPALKEVSFAVGAGERIGIVGRTGAGKTTLAYSFLRFIEPTSGKIRIDGVDISKLSLDEIRSNVMLIPQDPFLFSGTLRSNLNTHGTQSDKSLQAALRRVHLTGQSTSGSNFQDLDMSISAGGTNLSHGERQLICLARAVLEERKILILDEATSAVDKITDSAIQETIRSQFLDSTLIVIAHRLSTVADFDKLVVMSDGQVAEFDTPWTLLKQRGMFWEMVQQSSETDDVLRIVSEGLL
jgi:ABC-type multidrug transport system fused ATPase/permease subunit